MTQDQKHTPEPWYEAGDRIFYQKGERLLSDSLIAKFFASPRYALNVKTSYANAGRVVACVNACAGMADPAAEIATLRARVAELEKEAARGMSGKQTAVEWLAEVYSAQGSIFLMQFEQAIAMEREQIMQSYSDGLGNGAHHERGDAAESVLDEKRYYERTYGKEAQP
jgi:uncharacterized protein YhaN